MAPLWEILDLPLAMYLTCTVFINRMCERNDTGVQHSSFYKIKICKDLSRNLPDLIHYHPHLREGNTCSFSLFVSSHLVGGTPYPSHNTSTDPMSFLVGTPETGPRSLWEGRGTPVLDGWGKVPRPWIGTDGVLDMWRPVCLLHSRKRTFLLNLNSSYINVLLQRIIRITLKWI